MPRIYEHYVQTESYGLVLVSTVCESRSGFFCTAVFKVDENGAPIDESELDAMRYPTPKEALVGHLGMVRKWVIL